MQRNLLLVSTFIFILFSATANAQIAFHENFEVTDSMTSSGTPTWFQDSNFHTNGTQCIRDTVAQNGTAYLTSDAFSTLGNFFVVLTFDQICKISFADRGYVEVSSDNGSNWTTLDATGYLGGSTAFQSSHYFSSFSYGTTWVPATDAAMPQNSWWKTEIFDLSTVAANAAQVKIRFRITDGNGNGNSGNYGWLIDNVSVSAAVNELVPPHIAWSPPVLQSFVYYLGPYTISDTITDASGIGAATLYYTINNGSPVAVSMTNPSGNIWQGIIPPVNDSDTVCYYVHANDVWNNSAQLPVAGCVSFVASSGITFPYIDNFDVMTNLWTSSTTSGSSWQLGTPAFGATTGAHSPPNAWDIDLTSGYLDNTNTTLTSPVFNFIGIINAKLSFWRNQNSESGWDGTRLEYTTDGITWQILGAVGDLLATNWYTDAELQSSFLPGWSGNSGGWVQSTYKLTALNNVAGPTQFRFIFTSDPSITYDGFSIDNFSIIVPSPQDVGVTAIIRPGFSSPSGNVDTVKVAVQNFGSAAASNFNVSYSINGGTPVSQLHSATVQPGITDTLTFTTTYTVPAGLFSVCAYTQLTGDGNHTNDTLCGNSQGIPHVTIPYSDNFELPPYLWYDSSAIGTSWQLGTPAFGATNSAHSPTKAWDINLTTAYGNNARSVLTSPLFDFTGVVNAKLSFWQNRNIAIGDGFWFEYSTNGGTTWNVLGTAAADINATNWYTNANIGLTNHPGWDGNSGGWIKSTFRIPLTITGQNVQFRFVFTSDAATVSDGVSIDDFSVEPGFPVDLSVVALTQPATTIGTSGSLQTVQGVLKNLGTTTVSSSNVSYSVNGTLTATQTWNGTLVPGTTTTFTFTTQYTIPSGVYTLCAYPSLVSDGDHTNDTLCHDFYGIARFTIPYSDNFDTGIVAWRDSSVMAGTNWQLGTPAFGVTTGSHSSPSCWDINLTTTYGNDATSYLISPLFDFTGVPNSRLSFWQNRFSEDQWDGTRLEYSINGGGSWSILGTYNDPNAINWYNNAYIQSSALPAWDSISMSAPNGQGWQQSIYLHLPSVITGANVMFRFVFTSDPSITKDGFSIDDFSIILPPSHDVGVSAILQPGLASPAGSTDSVKVVIYNYGSDTTSHFPVSYSINGGTPVTQIYPGTLQPGVHDTVSFATSFTVPSGAYSICAWTSASNDGDHSNDTLCGNSMGRQRFTIPYTDNFDGGNSQWYDSSNNTGTNWQLGTPAFGQTTGSHSAPDCWDINLNSSYLDDAASYLISPLFDFTGVNGAQLSFWQNRNSEDQWDGMRLDYSIDAGNTWTVLGILNDPNAVNWYNNGVLNSSSLPAWDSISLSAPNVPGWEQSIYLSLPPAIAGQNVMFRFVFTSDASVTWDGVSVDDFSIVVPAVGISNVGETNSLKIYPNPSAGIFYLVNNNRMKNLSSIVVTNVLGETVWKKLSADSEFIQIDLSSKPNGIYFVSIASDTESSVQRIVLCK